MSNLAYGLYNLWVEPRLSLAPPTTNPISDVTFVSALSLFDAINVAPSAIFDLNARSPDSAH